MILFKFAKNQIFSGGIFGHKLCSKLKNKSTALVRQSFELSNALPEILIISFLHRENRNFVLTFFSKNLLNFTKVATLNVRLWAYLEA